MRAPSGIRVVSPSVPGLQPFQHLGWWQGDDLGDPIVGTVFNQTIEEGTIRFRVGVLFRPDRTKKQQLETVIILMTEIKEMWEYDDWLRD